jgi:hypothetical protein
LGAAVVIGGFGSLEVYNGIPRLGYFLLPLAFVLAVTGVIYLRIAKKKAQFGNEA